MAFVGRCDDPQLCSVIMNWKVLRRLPCGRIHSKDWKTHQVQSLRCRDTDFSCRNCFLQVQPPQQPGASQAPLIGSEGYIRILCSKFQSCPTTREYSNSFCSTGNLLVTAFVDSEQNPFNLAAKACQAPQQPMFPPTQAQV